MCSFSTGQPYESVLSSRMRLAHILIYSSRAAFWGYLQFGRGASEAVWSWVGKMRTAVFLTGLRDLPLQPPFQLTPEGGRTRD